MSTFWGNGRTRHWIRALVFILWLITFLALVLSEFLPSTRQFWVAHPVTAGLATSFVTLALTILVLDRLLRERDRRRWAKFVVLSYRALAQEAEDVRFKLHQYVDGSSARDLIAAISDEDLLVSPREIVRSNGALQDLDTRERVLLLAENLEWGRATYVGIRSIKRQNWDSLFRFAPILVAHTDTAEALNEFSALNESIVRLERLFEERAQQGWPELVSQSWAKEVADRWVDTYILAIELENRLHLTMTALDWVTEEDLEALLNRFR